jgi:ABC-type antimicrobial peptide transport system permease subunit
MGQGARPRQFTLSLKNGIVSVEASPAAVEPLQCARVLRMRFRTLIVRSLRFHWRAHLGVLLGAAVGSAALIGALVVGDSVRVSLRELAMQRLKNVHFAMDTGDRHFLSRLDESMANSLSQVGSGYSRSGITMNGPVTMRVPVTVSNRIVSHTTTNVVSFAKGATFPSGPGGVASLFTSTNHFLTASTVLKLDATATAQGGQARANKIRLLGVGPGFSPVIGSEVFSNIPPDAILLNEALAAQLRVIAGDVVTVRTRKPDALGGDSPLAPQDETAVVLRLRVHKVLSAAEGGNFNLTASQVPPYNAFVALPVLQEKAGVPHRANLVVSDAPHLTWWRMPEFSWVQWIGDRLRRMNVNLIQPSSGMMTNFLTSEESLEVLHRALHRRLSLSDLQLHLSAATSRNEIELRSSRVLLDQPVVDAVFRGATNAGSAEGLFAVKPYGVFTYLVNLIQHNSNSTPYSMVTAAEAPSVPANLGDDEIIISQWLADDLNAKAGSEISLTWFAPDQAAQLVEATNRFRVRGVLPMTDPALDRTLMPDFPGVAGAEKAGDWETGFPLVHEIRPKDDKYWSDYRGTPKAFVSLKTGQRLWASHLGSLTAIRFPAPPRYQEKSWYHETAVENAIKRILLPGSDSVLLAGGSASTDSSPDFFDPASLGFRFQDVHAQALAGASQSQDFGGLFIGFSFFLILAALILMALLFQFGIEQRTNEVGTLLALGFTPARVRNLLLGEGVAIAFLGGVIGALGGVGYAQAMLYGLATLWRDAVGTSALRFHATPLTLVIGLFASVAVSVLTIWIVLRRQAGRPASELLADGADLNVERSTLNVQRSKLSRRIALGSGIAALGMIGWAMFGGNGASAGLFFGAGALLLVAELAAVAMLLSALERSEASRQPTLVAMGLRNGTRRRSRSLASVALLACGSFLVAAIGANRLDAGRDATKRSSGTGGFALFGEATLPVVRDLNTTAGREFYGLDEKVIQGVRVVPFRVRDGDDASCLNLNRAQTPRLLGVKPELLAGRKAFTFAKVLKGLPTENQWELLRSADSHVRANRVPEPRGLGGPRSDADAIPAIGDAASIQWALGRKLGDTIEYTDERGQKFKLRLVAGVANSILQGNLIIDESEFVKRFPSETGYRMFLIDVPSNTGAESNRLEKVSAAMSRALQDVGLELTPTTARLAAFNAVQNTYLNTFQVLGGLGLLLGSAGLGVVVLRNVLERRGELGLLQAVGFRRRSLRWLVLSEHGGLLGLGLAVGITAAVAAVLPALLAPGAETHYVALVTTLAGVFVSGLVWTWLAARLALRGELLKALRNE